MTDWTIRRAQTGDADALARCIDAAYADYKARIPSLPDVSGGIGKDIADHNVWVAVADSRIVGGVVLLVVHGTDQSTATLANVAVDPGMGGNGLGRALIATAESQARLAGATELRLTTHVAIPQNVELYKRLGWHETDRTGNKIRMTKAL
jgi:GNAT superfamily N-acetyltransferase